MERSELPLGRTRKRMGLGRDQNWLAGARRTVEGDAVGVGERREGCCECSLSECQLRGELKRG